MRTLAAVLILLPAAQASPETTILCEAEEFRVETPGWRSLPYGSNYSVGTFANTFLSRKAYLGAPEQGDRSTAVMEIDVPKAGRYLALVRYEACYRFETQFRLRIEQGGAAKLDRLYGARKNLKIWAFRQKLKDELAWSWGATENIVWEGHDAGVELEAGRAKLTLVADRQPEPAARRNVDLVMLTSDEADVRMRIEKENYLPLDGLLTQAGDLHVKVQGTGTVTVPPGTEHSPYWVHLRTWKPKTITAPTADWVEVGSLLDSLNDGQWTLTVKGTSTLEFGVRSAAGIEPIARFEDVTGKITLAYDADTRRSRRIRRSEEVLYELVDYLKKRPVHGKPPQRTLIYGYTFDPRPENPKYTAAREEFIRLIGATAFVRDATEDIAESGLVRGYIDVRGKNPKQLEELCLKLKAEGRADRIAVVSLGDEIGLAAPKANDHEGFRAWLKERGLKPADLRCGDWDKVEYTSEKSRAALFYYSALYRHRVGIRAQKALTDVLRRHLPNAGIGANYSPHHKHVYLGEVHQFISLFREGGMTMPWGEDYIFQMPVATPQMNFLQIDMFRAAIKDRPDAKIQMYVMAHWPGNTPAHWRRQFYGAIAHGAKIFNLFEFRPVQAAYTENHVNLPEMYQEVRRAFHELGTFEDIVQDGRVRKGVTALWFSEAADIWGDNESPFDAAKRCLYIAIRHRQLPLDVVVEGDDLKDYEALFLADRHVSRTASKAIAAWVRAGGWVFATAGAGMLDEFNEPNATLRELFGVEEEKLEIDPEPVRLEKQDLPFARPLDTVTWGGSGSPAFGAVSRIKSNAEDRAGTFADMSPVRTRKGSAVYCGILPGLSYFRPAMPKRPVDRGSAEDALCHLIPTETDPSVLGFLGATAGPRPVQASNPLVETTVIESKHGALIPLVNWSAGPARELKLTVNIDLPRKTASLASGRPVKRDGNVFTFDLDVADALILR